MVFPLVGVTIWLVVGLIVGQPGLLLQHVGVGCSFSIVHGAEVTKFVQWKKMHPSGSVALALAAYQMVGVFGDGNGWISSLRSGSQAEAEQLRGEEDEDLVVILLLPGSFM